MAARLRLNVFVVFNGSRPIRPNVRLILVGDNADAADDCIAEHISSTDVCIPSDIPLASRCLNKGARVVSATGKQWTEANIGNALVGREIWRHLRELGTNTGGPAPLTKKDRSRFLSVLDTVVQAALREATRGWGEELVLRLRYHLPRTVFSTIMATKNVPFNLSEPNPSGKGGY